MSNKEDEKRKHKGIAKVIGIHETKLQRLERWMRTQFFIGIVVGVIISIATHYIFKFFGL